MDRRSPLAGLRDDRVVQAVVVVFVLAVAARLVLLGRRVAHQDEARVGYWTLRYMVDGRYEYRPIVHGPFIPIVNRYVFALLGPSDFTMRLPIALVGAAAPLAALLFRPRLRDSEVVALAALLAFNPVLLYYSRFMRQDVPLATFMLFAVGLFARALDARRGRESADSTGGGYGIAAGDGPPFVPDGSGGDTGSAGDPDPGSSGGSDPVGPSGADPGDDYGGEPIGGSGADPTGAGDASEFASDADAGADDATAGSDRLLSRRHRILAYAYAGMAALGLAFTTKENALLYLLCWLGAGVLLLDHRLYVDRVLGRSPVSVVLSAVPSPSEAKRLAGSWGPHAVALLVEFFVIVVFFYAPRGGGYPSPPGTTSVGLYSALLSLDPGAIYAVIQEATVGTWKEFYGTWAAGGHQDHPYIPYFEHYVKTLRAGALVVTLAAPVGFLLDRYGPDGPRDVVAFASYWGVASVLGYPLVTDIRAGWTTVHAIVPLAIPAAVGVALVYRLGRNALAEDDAPSVAIAAVLLLLIGAQVGYAAVGLVYLRPQDPDNQLVQYAQSSSTDLKPVLDDVRAAGRASDGVDVLYYGDEFHTPNESANDVPWAGPGWFGRLPLEWYFESYAVEMRDSEASFVVASTKDPTVVRNTDAPVVVALKNTDSATVAFNADDVDDYLVGYQRYEGHRYLFDSGTPSSLVIFVDTSRVPDPADVYDGVVTPSANETEIRPRPGGNPVGPDCPAPNATTGGNPEPPIGCR